MFIPALLPVQSDRIGTDDRSDFAAGALLVRPARVLTHPATTAKRRPDFQPHAPASMAALSASSIVLARMLREGVDDSPMLVGLLICKHLADGVGFINLLLISSEVANASFSALLGLQGDLRSLFEVRCKLLLQHAVRDWTRSQ